MTDNTNLDGFNLATTSQPVVASNTVVRAGGTYSAGSTINVSESFGVRREGIQAAVSGADGEFTIGAQGGSALVGDADYVGKFVSDTPGDLIQEQLGGIHRRLDIREPAFSDFTLLRDGRWVDTDGNIYNHPTGVKTSDAEIVDGGLDLAARTRSEGPENYTVSVGGNPTNQNVPARNG